MDAIRKIEAALAAGPSEGRPWELWTSNSYRRIPGAIEPTIQHSDNHPDLHATIETLEYVVAVQPKNIREVLQTLASKEAELVRLREVLMNVKATLVLANEMKDGPIVDTIWHGPAETLFDYIDNSFTQPPKEPI